MAEKEIYRLDIKVGVTGDGEAKTKLSALEKMTQQSEKRMKVISKITASPAVKLNDKLSSPLQKVSSKLTTLKNSNVTATIRLKDQASTYIDKVKAKMNEFKTANMTLSSNVKDESDGPLSKIKNNLNKINNSNATVKIKAKDETEGIINKVKEKLSNLTKFGAQKVIALGTAATLAIGGIGIGTSIKTFAEYEKGLSNVKAVTNATDIQMQQLDATAKKLGSTTAWSATHVTQAEELLGQAGFNVDETITALPGLLNLASAGDLDLAAATDIASGTLRAFNLDASQSSHVADVLALSASATNSDVTDLGETMKYVAPVSQALGISLEDTAAASGLLSNANIKGSQAGTVLRQTMARLASPTSEAAKAMQKYGINAFDSVGNMKPLSGVVDNLNSSLSKLTSQQRADVISTIFGTESMSGVLALMNQGGKSVSDLSEQLKDANGAAQQMADTKLDNLNGQWIRLKAAVEHMQISLGEKLAPYAKQFVSWMVDKMPAITDGVVKVADSIPKIVSILKTLSPLLVGIGAGFAAFKIGSGIASAIGVIAKIGSAIAGVLGGTTTLGAAMAALSGPVGWVALAIGAVVTALVVAYNKSEKFRECVGKVWSKLVELGLCIYEKVSPALEKIGTFLTEKVLPPLGKIAGFTLDKVVDGFIILCNFLENTVIPTVERLSQKVADTLGPAFKGITNFLSNDVFPAIQKVNDLICKNLLSAFNELEKSGSKIYSTWKPTIDKLKEESKIIGEKVKEILDKIRPVLDKIAPKIQNITDKSSELGKTLDSIRSITDIFGGVALASLLEPIIIPLEIAKSAIEGISEAIDGLSNAFQGVTQIMQGIKDGNWSITWQGIQQVALGAIEGIEAPWSVMVGIVTAPVTAFVDILDSQFHDKIAGIKQAWNNMIQLLSHPITGTINLIRTGTFDGSGSSENSVASKASGYLESVARGAGKIKNWVIGKENYTGTDNGIKGVNSVAEKGCELVMGRQLRWFDGGEKVLNHQKTMDLMQGNNVAKAYSTTNKISNNTESRISNLNNDQYNNNIKQGQYSVAQPQQVQVATSGGNNIQVDVQVNCDNDIDTIVEETTQEVGIKLKEALLNIKK